FDLLVYLSTLPSFPTRRSSDLGKQRSGSRLGIPQQFGINNRQTFLVHLAAHHLDALGVILGTDFKYLIDGFVLVGCLEQAGGIASVQPLFLASKKQLVVILQDKKLAHITRVLLYCGCGVGDRARPVPNLAGLFSFPGVRASPI